MSETKPDDQHPKARRPLVFVLLGVFLWGAAGLLIFDRQHVHTSIAPRPQPYHYNIHQSVSRTVAYRQSSFFGDSPDPSNSAYVADLTKDITAGFHYSFSANKTTDLSYWYSAVATVRATYGSQGSEGGIANVWSKQYPLLTPVSGSRATKSLSFDPVVRIPFADYKKDMDQFKNAVTAPLNSELVVTYTVRMSGKVNGTPFSDTKVSTVTAPLDQQIYELTVKYEKTDRQDVYPADSQRLQDVITAYEMPAALLLAALGLAYAVYGFRRQIFKSPYTRELERIYRYHDGIIIRARRPVNLAGKNIVPVESFDDLLNLEEELKAPIVASPAGDSATQFTITRDDIVYVYTIGDYTMPDPPPPPPPSNDAPHGQHKRPVSKRVSG